MRVIAAIDLIGGLAVHARGGRRDLYAPVRAVAGMAIPDGDAPALARAYIDRLGIRELYVADLDGLSGRSPQDALVATLAAAATTTLVDAGVSSVSRAREVSALGVVRPIVALETLSSARVLDDICRSIGGARVAFSLDLRSGAPLTADGRLAGQPAEAIAARAAEAGVGTIIVIDLARVGARIGPDFALIEHVRAAAPTVTLLAAGGVRDAADVARLSACGGDGAIVATALLEGRLGVPVATVADEGFTESETGCNRAGTECE
jgi:phosphoribosylformimino-5-aminoimidazole carboxamide ribotide isomerase